MTNRRELVLMTDGLWVWVLAHGARARARVAFREFAWAGGEPSALYTGLIIVLYATCQH